MKSQRQRLHPSTAPCLLPWQHYASPPACALTSTHSARRISRTAGRAAAASAARPARSPQLGPASALVPVAAAMVATPPFTCLNCEALLLNKCSAGDWTKSERQSGEGRRGSLLPLEGEGLAEGHLSLRPVTMATGPAQCRGERGADTMATQAVTATALLGRGLLKRQALLRELMTCVVLQSCQNLSPHVSDQEAPRRCP